MGQHVHGPPPAAAQGLCMLHLTQSDSYVLSHFNMSEIKNPLTTDSMYYFSVARKTIAHLTISGIL